MFDETPTWGEQGDESAQAPESSWAGVPGRGHWRWICLQIPRPDSGSKLSETTKTRSQSQPSGEECSVVRARVRLSARSQRLAPAPQRPTPKAVLARVGLQRARIREKGPATRVESAVSLVRSVSARVAIPHACQNCVSTSGTYDPTAVAVSLPPNRDSWAPARQDSGDCADSRKPAQFGARHRHEAGIVSRH
jgi:hypothetical protein